MQEQLSDSNSGSAQPDVSLVIPLYNEEGNVRSLVATLAPALAGLDHELILVDNGSRDGTSGLIDELAAAADTIRKVTVEHNEGYGHGILSGLREARGRWVAFMCGDLQVAEADVAVILEKAVSEGHDLVKAVRVDRRDGFKRRFFSFALNRLVPLVFATGGQDVNGTPKVMTRDLFQRLSLESKRWFIDAEIMIKASTMPTLSLAEVPVVFHPRREGRSTVRCITASLEFLKEMARYRFTHLQRYRVARQPEPSRAPGG